MSKHAMAGAVTLCGVGLCMIGGALMLQGGSEAHAAAGALHAAAGAVASTSATQAGTERVVVWYGTYGGMYGNFVGGVLLRAWSDGTIEMKKMSTFSASESGGGCTSAMPCSSPWLVVSAPTQGFRAAADLNADQLVDALDLATVLNSWGDAPRVPFPTSDCPLNLTNP